MSRPTPPGGSGAAAPAPPPDPAAPWVPLADVPSMLPQIGGRPVSRSTAHRWATSGLYGAKLETRRVGRRLLTTAAALARFLAAVEGAGAGRGGER